MSKTVESMVIDDDNANTGSASSGIDVKAKEQEIYALGRQYVKEGRANDLKILLRDIRPFFKEIPKARTAKIVRSIIDFVSQIPGSYDLQIELFTDCIKWCRQEQRTFLRHRVETRLASLLVQQHKYQQGLELLSKLLKEVKKLDDKLLLVEIHLIESKIHYSLLNVPKAKAALTAARTSANAIHCPPLLQAEIDLMSGILHGQQKDHKTAFSYFFEAFETLHVSDDERASQALKYMLLAKIMSNSPREVQILSSSKNGIKYQGKDIEALKAVAKCHQARSLKLFAQSLETYKTELEEDEIVRNHIKDLYENLLEQNLLRILEPFSHVELDHVAKLIELPYERVLSKLSEMILDDKFHGTLDQGNGIVIVFDEPAIQSTYEDVVSTVKQMSSVVDSLYEKANKLTC